MKNVDLLDLASDILIDAILDIRKDPDKSIELIKKAVEILSKLSDRLGEQK